MEVAKEDYIRACEKSGGKKKKRRKKKRNNITFR